MTRPLLSSHSRFGQRVRRRYEDQLHALPEGLPDPQTMAQVFKALQVQGLDTGSALRIMRQLVLERLLCLDCDAQAPLQQITQAMTHLAEFALNKACAEVQRALTRPMARPPHRPDCARNCGSWAWASSVPGNSMYLATLT